MATAQERRAAVADARATVRSLYGSELEAKSTDDFCLTVSLSRRSVAPGFGLEAVARAAPTGMPAIPTVVEFAAPATPPRVPIPRELSNWSAIGTETHADSTVAYPNTTMLRSALVHTARTSAYQVVGDVYNEIERLSGTSLGPAPEMVGVPQIPTLVTQICWLNHTLRTWAGPEVLADVCADHNVTSVDVPRRLEADATARNHTAIGYPAFFDAEHLTGKGITVAVIDTEVALRHPALRGRVVQRRNFTAEPWGNPSSHGTAVAGIIAADDIDNGGIAPGATIYNYKVLATSHLLNGDSFSGGLAIQHALEDGAAIANCSWGAGPVTSTKSPEAVAAEAAWALGMVVVKSAGNRGPGRATMTRPAEAEGIIVVGATDLDGKAVEDYSSRGPAGPRSGPDVVAPGGGAGGNIAACLIAGGFGDAGAGTSYAAPHVSGMLALWLEKDPTLDPGQLRDKLVNEAKRISRGTVSAKGKGLAHFA
ncbi:serine protease AprX [Kribbella antiqua]|uniref:Serine protease AprX n=1 Tax=Kribbella antiqua TaxID=2512217 RepID=A0A4R2IEF5_9ACTN|nr:S8 family serine peptidase [Kribbella antiqua]TCO42562.1 serine protease AprX [Kribbella antiqua]